MLHKTDRLHTKSLVPAAHFTFPMANWSKWPKYPFSLVTEVAWTTTTKIWSEFGQNQRPAFLSCFSKQTRRVVGGLKWTEWKWLDQTVVKLERKAWESSHWLEGALPSNELIFEQVYFHRPLAFFGALRSASTSACPCPVCCLVIKLNWIWVCTHVRIGQNLAHTSSLAMQPVCIFCMALAKRGMEKWPPKCCYYKNVNIAWRIDLTFFYPINKM